MEQVEKIQTKIEKYLGINYLKVISNVKSCIFRK